MMSYEPADHAGRLVESRLIAKAHLTAYANRRSLAMTLSAGQAGDAPLQPAVLDTIVVRYGTAAPPPQSRSGCWATSWDARSTGSRIGVVARPATTSPSSPYRAGFAMALIVE